MRQQIVGRDAIVKASADAVQVIFHDRCLHERKRICRAIAACRTVLLLAFWHLWSCLSRDQFSGPLCVARVAVQHTQTQRGSIESIILDEAVVAGDP